MTFSTNFEKGGGGRGGGGGEGSQKLVPKAAAGHARSLGTFADHL